MRISREHARVASVLALLSLVAVVAAAGLGGVLDDRWEDFKGQGDGSPAGESRASQLFDVSGSGRYQFWEGAVEANKTDPLVGIGPGTFEFWWSRNGTLPGFIRDAHSLYLETLGELGIIGLVLLGGFILGVIGVGAVRSLRAPPELRLGLAAATASAAAFGAAAAVDWNWELAALPAAFMLVGAIAVAGGGSVSGSRTGARRRSSGSPRVARIAVIGLALAAMTAIALPLAAASDVRESRQEVAAGDLEQALARARSAASVQPYAASPRIQEALILELQGRFDAAILAAREATRAESTNWRNWLILSRLEARNGNAQASVRAFRRARALDPRAPYFAQ